MGSKEIPSTTFKFTLYKGLVDQEGVVHRQGMMSLATGNDEIYVHKDSRVRENPSYGVLVILSQVITQLGSLSSVTPELLENLFLVDLVYLEDFFNQIQQPRVELSLSGEL